MPKVAKLQKKKRESEHQIRDELRTDKPMQRITAKREERDKLVTKMVKKLSISHCRATKTAFEHYFNTVHVRSKLWEPENKALVYKFVRENNAFMQRLAQRKANNDEEYVAQQRNVSVLNLTDDHKNSLAELSRSMFTPTKDGFGSVINVPVAQATNIVLQNQTVPSDSTYSIRRSARKTPLRSQNHSRSLVLEDPSSPIRLNDPSRSQLNQTYGIQQGTPLRQQSRLNPTFRVEQGTPLTLANAATSFRRNDPAAGSTPGINFSAFSHQESDGAYGPVFSNLDSQKEFMKGMESFRFDSDNQAAVPKIIIQGSTPKKLLNTKIPTLKKKIQLLQNVHLNSRIQDTEDIEQIIQEISVLSPEVLDVNAFVISSPAPDIVPGIYRVLRVRRDDHIDITRRDITFTE
ncbi:unnamed protein product [Diamesa serratosioi]